MLLLSLVHAAPPVEELPHGHVDWTRGVLVVEATGSPNTGAWSDLGVAEKDAYGQLELRLADHAARVAFDGDRDAGQLMAEGDEVARKLRESQGSWSIAETRYHASGKVEVRAELDLQPWLRAALVDEAAADPDRDLSATSRTGLVVDARETGARPCFAPKLLDADGQVLYGAGTLDPEQAASAAPALWVADPAQAEAGQLAGTEPLFVVASDASGCDVVLDAQSAASVRALAETRVLANALVVVVVR